MSHKNNKHTFKLTYSEYYSKIFESYDAATVEQRPKTEDELFDIYVTSTDPILDFTKDLLKLDTKALDNEVRAMFGHLSEYRLSDGKDRGELQKAYGHFRRLNIDMFKIICDEFDKALLHWLKKYSHYDYRNMKEDFLKALVQQYLKAHSEYLNAQQEERVGSDYNKHQIVSIYHSAAKQYIDVWRLLAQYKKQTVIVKIKRISKVAVSSAFTIAGIIWSTWEIFHMVNMV